jgi:hypothetical protein
MFEFAFAANHATSRKLLAPVFNRLRHLGGAGRQPAALP